MTNAFYIGDIVRHKGEDGHIRVGIVRRVIERPGKILAQICAPGPGFGQVVEVIQSAGDPNPLFHAPRESVPNIGDTVRYEPHEGAGPHIGKVWAILLLRSGEALVRIDRSDSPLCRLIEGAAE